MAVSNEVHLITVHGTWARGFWRNRTAAELGKRKKPPWCFTPRCFPGFELPWFCAGSEFLKSLQSELLSQGLTSTVEAFEWSGANSIVDRQRGGDDLAKMLKPLEKSRVVLLTHSHGGSVALAALGRSDAPAVEAVAMATPFIKLQDQTNVEDPSHHRRKGARVPRLCYGRPDFSPLRRLSCRAVDGSRCTRCDRIRDRRRPPAGLFVTCVISALVDTSHGVRAHEAFS